MDSDQVLAVFLKSKSPGMEEEKCDSTDINNVFDSIALTEQKLADIGFKEGFQTGLREGEIEGFHLGYHRGAELGAELGYYKGVVETWLVLGAKKENLVSQKAQATLLKVRQMIEQFPQSNEENVDLTELTDQVRSSYKRACSLLKINGLYPEATKLTF